MLIIIIFVYINYSIITKIIMFKFLNIFKSKTTIEKLEIKYQKTLTEAFELSKTNRTASDAKYAEAAKIADEIDYLKKKMK